MALWKNAVEVFCGVSLSSGFPDLSHYSTWLMGTVTRESVLMVLQWVCAVRDSSARGTPGQGGVCRLVRGTVSIFLFPYLFLEVSHRVQPALKVEGS